MPENVDPNTLRRARAVHVFSLWAPDRARDSARVLLPIPPPAVGSVVRVGVWLACGEIGLVVRVWVLGLWVWVGVLLWRVEAFGGIGVCFRRVGSLGER